MDLEQAIAAARATRESVLTTIKRDGRPQLSNVLHAVDEAGVIRVSITTGRAKYHNLRREPWAALHVNGGSHFSYAVIEAGAHLSASAADPGDDTVEALVELYRQIAGEHDDWEAYRHAMVDEGRVLLELHPTRAYGMLGDLPPASGT